MPIYVYRCSNCGNQQDVLQKISDPLLSVCPACGQDTYEKQVTAAGFRLKGTGWYATDFRDGKAASKAADSSKAAAAQQGSGESSTAASSPARADAGSGTGSVSTAAAGTKAGS